MGHLAVGATEKRQRSQTWNLAVILTAGVVLLVVGILDLRETQLLRTEGEFARGKVTGKHRSGGKSSSYYLDLEFQTRAGRSVALTESVGRGRFDRTRPGDTVPLHYLPGDPTVMKIGATPQPNRFWFFMSAAAFAIGGVYYLFALWRFSAAARQESS